MYKEEASLKRSLTDGSSGWIKEVESKYIYEEIKE